MIMLKSIWAGALLVALVMFGSSTVQATDQVVAHGAISRTSNMAAGTSGFEAVRQFIIQHSSAEQHVSLGDARSLPASFHVTHTALIREPSDLVRAQDVNFPPVPLPGQGSPGDTLSISSCSKHVSETWTYAWGMTNNGVEGWVLQDYTWSTVTKCKDATAQ